MVEHWVDAAFGLVQGLVLLALSPGLLGLIRWVKARAQGRKRGGARLLQPYYDLHRLMRQRSVRAATSSAVFAAVPILLVACYGTLAFAVPLFGAPPLLDIDFITLVYLLALARFALALAGLDAGAPFGGLGSSRVMFLNLPTEVALLLVGAALSLRWNTLSLTDLINLQSGCGATLLLQIDVLLTATALSIILALEAGRIPIDNPATHLELTIGQKAVTLEYAGRDLALIQWGQAARLTVLLALLVALFIRPGLSSLPSIGPGLSLLSVALLALLLALWEAWRPQLRLRKIMRPGVVSAVFSLSAILYIVVTKPGVYQ